MAKNAFSFKKYNHNSTERLEIETAPDAKLVNGSLIYMSTAGKPTPVGDVARSTAKNIYLVAEEAETSADYVVAYNIDDESDIIAADMRFIDIKDDAKIGKLVGFASTHVLTKELGLDETAISNKIAQIVSYEDEKIRKVGTATLTVVTAGEALSAGEKFSLDGTSKVTKTLGNKVYVAGADYVSGTSVTVNVYKEPVGVILV